MKTLTKILLVGSLLVSVGTPSLLADVAKGQKYYLKSFKSKFKMNGVQFATLHTQEEWEELFENRGEKFIAEFGTRFPKHLGYLSNPKTWEKLEHVRDFALKYSSDSGNVPSCG